MTSRTERAWRWRMTPDLIILCWLSCSKAFRSSSPRWTEPSFPRGILWQHSWLPELKMQRSRIWEKVQKLKSWNYSNKNSRPMWRILQQRYSKREQADHRKIHSLPWEGFKQRPDDHFWGCSTWVDGLHLRFKFNKQLTVYSMLTTVTDKVLGTQRWKMMWLSPQGVHCLMGETI